MTDAKKSATALYCAIAVAALLWFVMFSPWTAPHLNFWAAMSLAACTLSALAFKGLGLSGLKAALHISTAREALVQLALGVAIACMLWGVFWIGDKVAAWMFSFAKDQVNMVYGKKDGSNPALIGVLLLVLIGPAEEIFWRGYVQNKLAGMAGPFASMIITCAIYTLVHIWSFNFMLVMAALVAGAAWGFLYWYKPSWLPALVISHALWDAMVFVVFPI